jgi:ribonuclease Z
VLDYERLPITIHMYDLKPGEIIKTKDFTVSTFPVTHRGPGCFGFVFQEKTHRPFLAEQADALGVPAGPERGKLVAGQSITLADGRVITPEMVLGETTAGVKLVYVGDTVRTDNLREYVQDANTLIIEATFLESETEEARAFGHLTAKQAATLALECNVGSLILNHVSRRYRERDIIEEAQATFPNAYVARDFDRFATRRARPVEKLNADGTRMYDAHQDDKEALNGDTEVD